MSPALVTWANGVCQAFAGARADPDPAAQDYSKLPLDQAKALFQFDVKSANLLDGLATASRRLAVMDTPFEAAHQQGPFTQALVTTKTLYEAAITQVSQARTIAISTLTKGLADVTQSIQTAILAAPADVQQALNNC